MSEPAGTSRVTGTPSFRRWFRDSKMVDEQGVPLLMTHGSNAKKPFTVFKLTKTRENSLSQGFYFSDIPHHGQAYSGTGIVFSAYLSIENPFIMDWRTDEGRARSVEDGARIGIEIRAGLWMVGDRKENRKKLIRAGYDGVMVYQPETDSYPAHRETIAFHSVQIKSATDNNGKFNRNDPDITH